MILMIGLQISVSGCATKIVLLPQDAAYYYKKWQQELKEGQECEHDLTTLKDSCDKLIPQIP